MIERKNDIRALYWRNKLKNFLLYSDEKWILDQYNQIKRFCSDNSVEAVPTCFSINDLKVVGPPSEMASLSDNSSGKTSGGSSKKKNNFEKRAGSIESQSTDDGHSTLSKDGDSEKSAQNQIPKEKCITVDISSLLETFIEIEKNGEMRKILKNKNVDREKLRYLGERSVVHEKDEYEGYIEESSIPKSLFLKQSSMINFKRNWESLVEGLEGVTK